MAKNSIRDFDNTSGNNTDIQSVDISEGCSPAGINNALREMMADLADVNDGTVSLTSPSADSMAVTGDLTVDTSTLKVDSTNNRVGIGTASPDSTLSIENTTSSGATIKYDGQANGEFGLRIQSNVSGGNFESDFAVGGTALLDLFANSSTTSGGDFLVARTQASDPVLLVKGNGNVGIGVSPAQKLHLQTGGTTYMRSENTGISTVTDFGTDSTGSIIINRSAKPMRFFTDSAERLRVDASGNVLVGTTDTTPYNNTSGGGFVVAASGLTSIARETTSDTQSVLHLNTTGVDCILAEFAKDGTTVGAIGSNSGTKLYIGAGDAAFRFDPDNNSVRPHNASTNGSTDNFLDLGASSTRFDDIYATNGTIQTSDANEKQQIASLTDAEMTAAKAISKLFKTFKWNDKVETKGNAARRHAGVIAQDVQQAMADAGLDAGDYAFFISTTWWETQTDVPAVVAVAAQDAVLDDDGNIVTEAVEAVEARDAYTRTDTYNTADEAPEGATERTRLGIRYPELLAFVGAATEQRLADLETAKTDFEARLTALEAN